MKTEIKQFCNSYTEALAPFASKVDEVLKGLPREGLTQTWRAQLQEVSHRSDALTAKIAEQQAYLLIFGPLKSGKSTLMNAISGTYVSQVSSLPAYPSLVYVKDGEEHSFRAITYAGDTITYENAEAMSSAIEEAHQRLAERILEVEKEGISFDPHEHLPNAIRRVHVEMPAESLAESGAVMVDTPGLYTRMRFGYDSMTRDFRDSASCAIFVVKSDNLFFEKVFEEFNELLGNFSRIFLVVNIDSSKNDLKPDGSIGPSLESRSPGKVIEAFQSLAMSAPLREAYENGRLHVYSIDLLKAASEELNHSSDTEAEVDHEYGNGEDGFDSFMDDLANYLNSSAYLYEFIHDSIMAGETLRREAAVVSDQEAGQKLREIEETLIKDKKEAESRLEALRGINAINWDAAYEELRKEKDSLVGEYSGKDRSGFTIRLDQALEKWLKSDDTLRSLRVDYLNRVIEDETSGDVKKIFERLRRLLETKTAGARLSYKDIQALDQAGLRLDELVPLGDKENNHKENFLPAPRFDLQPEDVPLKRSFWELILLRKKKLVRERFFGAEGNEFIPARRKAHRISGKCLEAFRERIINYPNEEMIQYQQDAIDQFLNNYVGRLKMTLKKQCLELEKQMKARLTEAEATLKSNRELQSLMKTLSASSEELLGSLEELKARYHVAINVASAEADPEADPEAEVVRFEDAS